MMKRTSIFALAITGLLLIVPQKTGAQVTYFFDGGSHLIDYAINGSVEVVDSFSGNPTEVELGDGGSITWDFRGYGNSLITISGGVGHSYVGYDSSQTTITGATITGYVSIQGGNSRADISDVVITERLGVSNGSQVQIWGGSIGTDLSATGHAKVHIGGGSIGGDILLGATGGDITTAIVTLEGMDFAIDGVPVGYGEYVNTGENYGYYGFYSAGVLTGILTNGDVVNSYFEIYDDAKIVLVPEPASLSLLAIGGLGVIHYGRKRHRGK